MADAYRFPLGSADSPTPALLGNVEVSQHGEKTPGVVELVAQRGDRVTLLSLEEQEGDAEIVFVGEMYGTTVGTLHQIRAADRLQRFLVLYGHLDRAGPGVIAGARLQAGVELGAVGDTGSPGEVRLRLEVRQLRDGARLEPAEAQRLLDASLTYPCDPRNVLPLRAR
ncbi:uncharacterized protein CMC5_001140 [Chondromyces crocatus]|uniref:Peptidase M23 domain-containing protein n=2 Tax=Chondromyces crocatus TaxID=52 RepID=A0A0K1E5N6_CHOCO|nr:uncharacterized protein CMC5_001140 [Chondromyces crocatus]